MAASCSWNLRHTSRNTTPIMRNIFKESRANKQGRNSHERKDIQLGCQRAKWVRSFFSSFWFSDHILEIWPTFEQLLNNLSKFDTFWPLLTNFDHFLSNFWAIFEQFWAWGPRAGPEDRRAGPLNDQISVYPTTCLLGKNSDVNMHLIWQWQ